MKMRWLLYFVTCILSDKVISYGTRFYGYRRSKTIVTLLATKHVTKGNPFGMLLVNTNEARKGVGGALRRTVAILMLCPLLFGGPLHANGDDELAKYAAEGNKVGVDTQCFFRKCAVETAKCANDPHCLKGLACLSRYIIRCVSY